MPSDDDQFTGPLRRWSDLSIGDMIFAYRKAKADCHFERALSLTRTFAEYERNLESNLSALLNRLRSPSRLELVEDDGLIGEPCLVVKKLDARKPEHKGGTASASTGHSYFSDPERSFASFRRHHELTAEFRLAGHFSVNFHLLSALWTNRVGHRLDACLSRDVYASRVRRLRPDSQGRTGRYHIRCIGSMAPYFTQYRTWREHGLAAMKRSLDSGEKVIGVTLDLRNYFHRIDPRFVLDRVFHQSIGLGKETADRDVIVCAPLTPTDKELSALFVGTLEAWARRAHDMLRSAQVGTEATGLAVAGVPICVTACRIMANVLLHRWDEGIREGLSPIYYGRYVDDMFIVLRDPGTLADASEVMGYLSTRLPAGMMATDTDSNGERDISLGSYQRRSTLTIQDRKCRTFMLEGKAGLDLLETIRSEIHDLSSERRLMPDLDATRFPLAKSVLSAAERPEDKADSFRKAEKLSLRRMAWAIELRNAETLSLDLPRAEWTGERREFYRFARSHVLRPENLLDHFDYLPRLLGLAVACHDWEDATQLVASARRGLDQVRDACRSTSRGFKVNGHDADLGTGVGWQMVNATFEHLVHETILRSWPWLDSSTGPSPIPVNAAARKLLREARLQEHALRTTVARIAQADLGRTPLKEHPARLSPASATSPARELAEVDWLEPTLGDDAHVIADFLLRTRSLRLSEYLPHHDRTLDEEVIPYLFPTRPYTPREIAELDPRCVGFGQGGVERSPTAVWAKQVRAFRGIWTKEDLPGAAPRDGKNNSGVHVVHLSDSLEMPHPVLCLANLEMNDDEWRASAENKPILSLARYRRLVRLVNQVIHAEPKPDYVLLPELALPRRWVNSVVNRLLQERISVIAGVEYAHIPPNLVRNDAVLALTDNRLGFESSVLIWQPKSEPAPNEERDLVAVHGRGWCPPDRVGPPVYRHNGFDFAVMICSELQEVSYRHKVRGEVDAVMVLSWNQDLDTFSPLVESASLDVHAFVALANNRRYGDSRVRSPAKERHERDLCRVRGGKDDYIVVVELDVEGLRKFQSRAKRWAREGDRFKPVPQGFTIAPRRWIVPE